MIAKRQQPLNPVGRYMSPAGVVQRHCMAVVLHGQPPNNIVDAAADSPGSVVERDFGIVIVGS